METVINIGTFKKPKKQSSRPIARKSSNRVPAIETNKSHGKDQVTFGDRVTIRDVNTQDTFVITLESNRHNRHLMKEIEKSVLGLWLDSKFIYKDNTCQVVEIQRSADHEIG